MGPTIARVGLDGRHLSDLDDDGLPQRRRCPLKRACFRPRPSSAVSSAVGIGADGQAVGSVAAEPGYRARGRRPAAASPRSRHAVGRRSFAGSVRARRYTRARARHPRRVAGDLGAAGRWLHPILDRCGLTRWAVAGLPLGRDPRAAARHAGRESADVAPMGPDQRQRSTPHIAAADRGQR